MTKALRRCIVLLGLLALCGKVAAQETTTGSLAGQVTDVRGSRFLAQR